MDNVNLGTSNSNQNLQAKQDNLYNSFISNNTIQNQAPVKDTVELSSKTDKFKESKPDNNTTNPVQSNDKLEIASKSDNAIDNKPDNNISPVLSNDKIEISYNKGKNSEPKTDTAALSSSKDTVEISSQKDKDATNSVSKNDTDPVVAHVKTSNSSNSVKNMLLSTLIFSGGAFLAMLAFPKCTNRQAKSLLKDTFNVIKKSDVRFSDVAGVDEAKQEVAEVVDFLKDPEKYKKLGARIPKGILLSGPPGTGKTLLAQALAGEAGVPFISVSGSDFVEKYVGVGAARVRNLFMEANKHEKCIVFIDEIDAIGRKRGADDRNDERESTLNQLLAEMGGFIKRENVIVIGATNRPEILDEALVRAGRFDRKIVVGLPDVKGREQILAVHKKDRPLADDVLLGVIAKRTAGYSGAELANLMNEAAIFAAQKKRTKITMADIDEAIDKIAGGGPVRKLVMSDKEKRNTADHEVGHALAILMHKGNWGMHKISIMPRGSSLGRVSILPEDKISETKSDLLARIRILLAGRAAEEVMSGVKQVTTGASEDIKRATDAANYIITRFSSVDRDLLTSEASKAKVDQEVTELLETQYRKTVELLTDYKELIRHISNELCGKETLTVDEFKAIIAKHTGKKELPQQEAE